MRYVFVSDDGPPIYPDSITCWLRKFSERRGLAAVSMRLGHAKVSAF